MLTEEQYLLIQMAEECAEVTQRICKALRFTLEEVQPGQDLTNAQRIDQEFVDLVTVQGELVKRHTLSRPLVCGIKKAKIERFMNYSRERGVLP